MRLPRIIGILLAAGQSRRMGRNKLHLPLANTTIGSKSLRSALSSQLDHTIVVTNPVDELDWVDVAVLKGTSFHKWSQAVCSEADQGQAHSLKFGLCKAEQMGADAVVILLADQPFLPVEVINRLIDHYYHSLKYGTETDFVASSLYKVIQPPILFSHSFFSKLMTIKGDEGARKLLHQQPSNTGITLDYKDWRGFYDVDTEEDYKWVKGWS